MEEFINYVQKRLDDAWNIYQESLSDKSEYCRSEGLSSDTRDLMLQNTEDDFKQEIMYLYNLCYQRQLPEPEIEKIFGDGGWIN